MDNNQTHHFLHHPSAGCSASPRKKAIEIAAVTYDATAAGVDVWRGSNLMLNNKK